MLVIDHDFGKELLGTTIPESHAEGFTGLRQVNTWTLTNDCSEDDYYYWLAFEYQNERRLDVMLRLHQLYSNSKRLREREQLGIKLCKTA